MPTLSQLQSECQRAAHHCSNAASATPCLPTCAFPSVVSPLLLPAQQVDDLRGTPLSVGTLEEMIDENHAIVSSAGALCGGWWSQQ